MKHHFQVIRYIIILCSICLPYILIKQNTLIFFKHINKEKARGFIWKRELIPTHKVCFTWSMPIPGSILLTQSLSFFSDYLFMDDFADIPKFMVLFYESIRLLFIFTCTALIRFSYIIMLAICLLKCLWNSLF